MIENLASHLGFDRDSEHVPPVIHEELEPSIDRVNPKQNRRRAQNQSPVLTRKQLIDERMNRQRKSQFQAPGHHRAEDIKSEQPFMGFVILEKASDHRA